MRLKLKSEQVLGQRSVAFWTVISGICTLLALIVALYGLLPEARDDFPEARGGADHLDVHGVWLGQLVGSTGTLAYRFDLTQDGTHVTGKARAQNPANEERYVVFSVDGQVDQQTFAFEETRIVDSNPPDAWCLISASLHVANDGVLAGNWNTTHQNDLSSCKGISGNLNIRRQDD